MKVELVCDSANKYQYSFVAEPFFNNMLCSLQQ